MPTAACLVLVSCPVDSAEALARKLVELRLAACVNRIPNISSTYRWKDQVCCDEESLLLIKTRSDCVEALRAAVVQHHPYELPEVIAVDIAFGHLPYLEWIASCCDTSA
ncbi:MAG: divalent-cation tolerance protein CutA [Panacagrimonas sp.]